MELKDRIQKYIQELPPAVQGKGGQTALFNAALKVIGGFDLTAEQVAEYLWEWYNPRCVPPWDDNNAGDFMHQCAAAFKKAPAERGRLLESAERSRAGKPRALSLVGSQAADGSQAGKPRALSLAGLQAADGSQGAKCAPVRRINLIRTGDDSFYKLTTELENKTACSIFRPFAFGCYRNETPTWYKVRREWLFEYVDPDGSPFMLWLRMDLDGMKRKVFWPFHYVPNPDGTGEYVEGNDPGGKVFPFGVARFRFLENLIFTEGEKAAACVNRFLLENRFLNTSATCAPNGAKGWRDDLKEYFRGKNVFIWPDNDSSGVQYAQNVCRSLEGVARSVRTFREYPPGFPSHADAVEILEFFKNPKGKDDDPDR